MRLNYLPISTETVDQITRTSDGLIPPVEIAGLIERARLAGASDAAVIADLVLLRTEE